MNVETGPRLIVLSDAACTTGTKEAEERWFTEVLPALLASARPGAVAVQLRHKQETARRLLDWARWLRRVTRETGQRLLIGDRLDIARLVQADGVHLPEQGVAVEEARAFLGPKAWISRAWHGQPLAASESPDAWLLAPVCAPRKGRPALGIAGLREILARRAELKAGAATPVYALGGITAENACECHEAGAHGVAAIGALATRAGAEALMAALGIARGG